MSVQTRKNTGGTRAAIYARVSTAGGGQDVGLQLDELRQVAAQRGWNLVGEFVDEGISGSVASRPALDQMIDLARRGQIDLVVVWKLDRLGRSLQHLLALLDELAALGVGFVAVRDAGIDTTTPQGRLLLQLLGAFAEFERAMIRERVTAGVRRAQTQGKHCGRPAVELDLRPALALLAEGHGLKAISTMLGSNRATLRERLREAGHWPRPTGVENPTSESRP